MKIKLMPLLGGLIALSVASAPLILKAQAQVPEQPTPTQTTRQHRGMWDKLNLSDQQKTQMKQIHDDIRNQIKAVLTPDQQAQLETARQNRQQNRQANQANQANQASQPHRGRHSAMAALNLTDAQKTKIKAIKQDGKRRVEALLTADQKQQLEQMRQQWQQKRQQRQQQQPNNQ